MKLPDPINNPGAPGFSSQELKSIQPFLQDSMPNTKVISVTSGEQYWNLTLGYSDMLVTEFNILNQQIDKTIQRGEKLLVWLPQYEDWGFKLNNYFLLQQNQSTITLDQSGMRSLPTIGNLVQFQNHKKVYRIVDYSVGQTTIDISIYPDLRVQVPVGTQVSFTNINFSMDFRDRSQPISSAVFNSDGYYGEGITLELRESI